MGGFTREDLAQRAGVSVDYIDRLVGVRIVSSGEGNSPFSTGDVRRARFVHGLENTSIGLIAYKMGRTEDAVRGQAAKIHQSLKPTNQSPYGTQNKRKELAGPTSSS